MSLPSKVSFIHQTASDQLISLLRESKAQEAIILAFNGDDVAILTTLDLDRDLWVGLLERIKYKLLAEGE